jgi:DNA-directed RNA polymerase specialized sigma24 family protein
MARSSDPEVLLQHAVHVRPLARRPLFDADLADDVEQETWVTASRTRRAICATRAVGSRVVRRASGRLETRRGRRKEHELEPARARGPGRRAIRRSLGLAERGEALRAPSPLSGARARTTSDRPTTSTA